jgi:NOL1/NOP2/fmu family ribosome biogenesis protein
MGQIFKNRLKPDGALAFYAGLCRDAVECRELPEEEALKFLRKQDVAADVFADGVNLVLHDGLPLGFVKRVGARVNNMYPNSLRILK